MIRAAGSAVPPRAVITCWALSVLVGSTVVGVGLARPPDEPRALSPRTLDRYLREIVSAGITEIRVNGVYGSGHSGAWQFVAHLTWRDRDGSIQGGRTGLPLHAGAPPLDSPVDPSRLAPEHEIGWSLGQLHDVLGRLDGTDAELAMLELEISSARDSVIACQATLAVQAGPCTEHDRTGRRLRRFQAQLTNDPAEDARSVQRA